jgi:hypothetical protein
MRSNNQGRAWSLHTWPIGLAVALAVLALVATSPANSSSLGRCFTAYVPRPFLLPDGTTLEPGRLTVCNLRHYNGSTDIHELRFDGMTHGMVFGRRGKSTADCSHPELLFVVAGDGRQLQFLGYIWPGPHSASTFALYPIDQYRPPEYALDQDWYDRLRQDANATVLRVD